jgi:hypothetical protein
MLNVPASSQASLLPRNKRLAQILGQSPGPLWEQACEEFSAVLLRHRIKLLAGKPDPTAIAYRW